eukprot:1160286-Pelagomonas_calceolata.AAC.5
MAQSEKKQSPRKVVGKLEPDLLQGQPCFDGPRQVNVLLPLPLCLLQPRFYSISSSPKAHPRAVHITASVVRDVMPTGRVHEGIATTFLQNAPVGTKGGCQCCGLVRWIHVSAPRVITLFGATCARNICMVHVPTEIGTAK